MRIEKNFGERSQKYKGEPKKKYFLIYEGEKTEAQYFNGVIDNQVELGINALLEIVPLLRDSEQGSWSHPQKWMPLVIEYFENSKADTITAKIFAQKLSSWFSEEKIVGSESIYKMKDIMSLCERYFQATGIMSDDKVDWEETLKKVLAYLSEHINLFEAWTAIAEHVQKQVYSPELDEICLIIDRDAKNFKSEQYNEIKTICSKKHYQLFVSNPCFEFWLLLHFDKVFELTESDLLMNRRIGKSKSSKKFIEKTLSDILYGYNKNNLNFSGFKDRILVAIQNEKNFVRVWMD